MKAHTIPYIIGLIIAALLSCNGRGMSSQLEAINRIADEDPASALRVLDNYNKEIDAWSKGDRMKFELIRLKALNKTGAGNKSDANIRNIVSYFDKYGTSNDQMVAHYLLGRFHANNGEAPLALQSYYDAIEKADTAGQDCDYNTLAAIYGQIGMTFHSQNLPLDEIRAFKYYCKCIKKLGNEAEYIIAKSQLIRPYYLLGEKDSVLHIIESSYNELTKLGETKKAAELLPSSIYIYTERNELSKAKQLIDLFENQSGLFDTKGNIAKGREHYYVTKGFYELAVKDYNSAETLFRKAINFGYLSDGYKGLLSVYRYKNASDSIIRFSTLYERAQDSLHNKMQIDATHRMSELYNYSRSQKEAATESQKARNAHLWLIGILILTTFTGCKIFFIYQSYKKKQLNKINKLTESLKSAQKEYNNIREELRLLKDRDIKKLIAEKEQKEKELKKTIDELSHITEHSMTIDKLEDFEKSNIVELFHKKNNFKIGNSLPNKTEWRALEIQFSKDMPTAYRILAKEKKLSSLELHVCILIILDFEDFSIVNLTNSLSQTITTAKSRANRKIFNEKGAQTLKAGLIQLIKPA